LPFFRSVAAVAVARENGNAGNVFPYTSGRSDQNADWLSTNGRTAKKIGFDPICYGTAVTAQRQVETATAKRQRQNGNRMLETRHNGLSD